MATPLNLLLIDDSESDAQRLISALKNGGFKPSITRVADEADFRKALGEGHPDAIVGENEHPRLSGRDILAVLDEVAPGLPLILISKTVNYAVAAELMAAGAHDFIAKDDLARVPVALIRELKAAALHEEHHDTINDLRESEASARELAALLPDIVFETDLSGTLTYTNAAAVDATGITEEDYLRGLNVFDFIAPADHERVRENVRAILNGEASGEPNEYTFVRRDGSTFPARIRSHAVYRDGKPVGLRGVVVDMSEQKRQEETLRKSRDEAQRREEATSRKWMWAVQNAQFALSLYDAEDRLVEWNDRFGEGAFAEGELRVGMKFEETLREFVKRAQPDDSVGREEEWIQNRLAHRKNPVRPFVVRARGRVLSVQEHRMPDGGILQIAYDVTDQKEAEKALQRTQQNLEMVVSTAPVVLWAINKDGIYTLTRGRVLGALGWTDHELIGKSIFDVYGDHADIVEATKSALRGEDVRINHVLDGRVYEAHHRPIRSQSGEITGVAVVAVDITEGAVAEQALRASEERLRAVMDNSPAAIFLKDREGRLTLVNKAYENRHGLSAEDILGKTAGEILPKEIADQIEISDQRILSGDSLSAEEEILVEPDGKTHQRIFLVNRFAIPGPDGEVTAIGGVSTDVTAQKLAEEELRRSRDDLEQRVAVRTQELKERETILSALIQNSNSSIDLKNAEGRFELVNKTFENWHQLPADKVIGRFAEELFSDEVAKGVTERHQSVVESGKAIGIEIDRDFADGTTRHVLLTKFPVFDENGRIVKVGSIATDITENKRAEIALRESEERFRAVIDNTESAITLRDRDSRILLANKAFCLHRKREYEEIADKTLHELYPKDHADRLMVQHQEVLDTGESVTFEHVISESADDGRAVLATRFPVRDADGEIIAVGTIATDITERKTIEMALRESEQRFRAFIDNSSTAISMLDRDGRFVLANQETANRLAAGSVDAILGKTVFDMFPAANAAEYAAQDQRIMESGESEQIPYELPDSDGVVHSYLAQKFPIRDAEGDVVGLGVVSTDISEMKQADAALREREERFRAFVDHTPAAISLKDREGRFVVFNKEFMKRREYTDGESPLGKTVFDIFPAEMAKKLDRQDKEVLESGETIDVPLEITRPDGSRQFLQAVKFPVRDSTGAISGIGIISSDVTERKLAEEAVQETARLLQAVLDNSPTAISLKDTDGKLILVNEQWRRQYGLSDDDALGKSLIEIFPYDIAVELQNHDRRVIETGISTEFEMELPGPDGLPETDIVIKFPITGPDGEITGIGSVGTNITERKRAEEALRWSERDLRGILDNMVDTFFRTDREGRIMMVSPSVTNLLGLTPEEALGRQLEEFFSDPDGAPGLYDLVATSADETAGHEVRLTRQDGEEIWVLTTARQFLDEDGEVAGVEGVAHDITMRKRAEEALAESEGRFRDFAEASSDWMWESDADGKFSYISERIFEVVGIRPEEVIGKTREELSREGPVAPDWPAYQRLIKNRQLFRDLQYSIHNSAGDVRALRISGKPRFAEDGSFLGYRGTGTNITESLATERREAETRQRFLDAIETVPVGFALYDVEDRLVLWNRLYESFAWTQSALRAGMTFEEILRDSMVESPIKAAEGREEEWIAERVASHRDPEDTLVLQRGEKWLQIREHKTPDGSILLIIVDITDIRRAEESLRDSERQFRAILDNIPDLAWLKDDENRFITVNNVFSQTSGQSQDELTGKTDLDIWPEELGRNYYADDQEVFETGRRKRIEEQVQRADGSMIWVETIKAPVLDESGKVVGTVGTARDITERRNAEQELRKLSAAVEQSPAAILITDPEGAIEYANPTFFEITGYDPEDVLGQTPALMKADTVDSPHFDNMWQAIASGGEWRGEMRNRKKSGEHFWSSVAVSPVTDASGKVSHFLCIAEDTTEKRRMDEQLRHAQKLEAVGTLAGGVAHDFNNILTGVLGHCYIAVEKLEKENAVQFNLEQIRVASNRAKDLVQQLLAFSRRREASLKPVTLHGIVDEAVKLVHASIRSVIKIEWNVDENAGTVMADPTQIHQVLLNLCGNAADAIGDEAGTIDVSVERVVTDTAIEVVGTDLPPGHYARLRISDSGCGMDVYTQSRAFDPFFTTKPVGSGTGLGLAAVHGIIQDHSGGIQLESKPGEGTTFYVYLPCVDVEETHAEPRFETDFRGSERILLVDDERMVLQSIGPYLEHFGYKVEAFTSATAALAVFQARPEQFHLLVTDQVMPNMTGDVLAKRVRVIRPEIPVILCTGYAARSGKDAKEMMDVDQVVGKPVEPSELGMIIRKMLDKKK